MNEDESEQTKPVHSATLLKSIKKNRLDALEQLPKTTKRETASEARARRGKKIIKRGIGRAGVGQLREKKQERQLTAQGEAYKPKKQPESPSSQEEGLSDREVRRRLALKAGEKDRQTTAEIAKASQRQWERDQGKPVDKG